MRPGEILDAQWDLLDRLKNNEMFGHFTAIGADRNIGGPTADSRTPLPKDMSDVPAGRAWLRALTNYVEASYAYRVTHDMCLVLEHAAAALDERHEFDRTKAPTGCGIVRFDRPIEVQDVRGVKMLVHWAIWGPAWHPDSGHEAGVGFAFYNDVWTQPDEVWGEFLTVKNRFGAAGETIDQEHLDTVQKALGRWASVHQTIARDGQELGPSQVAAGPMQQAQVIAEGMQPQAATNLFRYMHALWLLLNQTIVQTEEEIPERAARRRAEKRGIPSKVTVIKLRRIAGANREDGESLVEWSHRWIVRGHWAWRKCGAEHPLAEPYEKGYRAWIYVHPYQKGPEDAPLIITDKVYSLDR